MYASPAGSIGSVFVLLCAFVPRFGYAICLSSLVLLVLVRVVIGFTHAHRIRRYLGQHVGSAGVQVVLVHPILVDGASMLGHLLLYPGHVLHHVGIHSWQPGVRAHDAPGHNAADKPAILLPGIRTQKWAARVALEIPIII